MSEPTPTVKKAKAPVRAIAQPEPFEEYEAAAEDRRELESQPWAANGEDARDLGETTTVTDMPGGGLKITEGQRVTIMKTSPDGRVLMESDDGDGNTFTKTLYSEGGIAQGYLNNYQRILAMRQSLIMYRDDSYYRAVIDGFVFFIIGKGISYKCLDESPDVQAHVDEFWKENKMKGRDKEIVMRYLKYGEVLIRYFKNGGSGSLAKAPRVRLIPFWRLDELKIDATDTEQLISAKLTNFNPGGFSSAGSLGGEQPEMVPAEELQYVVNSENDGGRGEPLFLTIMRSCKWYADFMLNRVVLNRWRTSIVLFKKIKGSAGQVTAVKNAVDNATKTGARGRIEKRIPKSGSVVTHNESVEYDYKSPKIEASDAKPDGDSLRQYICAGGMVPEFLLGDASTASKDMTLVADSPFVHKVEDFRELFEHVFGEMIARVIQQGIDSGKLKPKSTETQITESAAVMRGLRRVLSRLGLQEADAKGNLKNTKVVPTKTTATFEWPTLIQKDQLEEAQTLQIHKQLGLVSVETLQAKLGYDHDVEELRMKDDQDKANAQDEYAMKREAAISGGEPDDDETPAPKGGK
jgi:hypothetical protein